MSRGLNKVQLIGNLGAAPEVRQLQTGSVANLRVATTESWTDKTTNERKESTEWHQVVIYGPLADIAARYTQKGSKVFIEGKLKTRKYVDQQGVEKYTTEIIGNELILLDKPEGQQGGYAQAPAQHAPQQGGYAPQAPVQHAPQQGGYAPQAPVQHAPQQGGYAPQAPVQHAPQQGGYAPQAPVQHAPQQGGYAPQGGYQQPASGFDDDDIPF